MENLVVYGIGAVALGYFALTIWKKIKGQGGSCCSSDSCDDCGCSSNKGNDK
jgi:hypothetical protein